jgi:hypothetical protein
MNEVTNNYTLYVMGEYDGIHKPYIEKHLSSGSSSGTIKEEIICNLIGAKHNPKGTGFDGWTLPELRPLEVKAETYNKDHKLNGGAAFGSIISHIKLEEFLKADQVYYGSGWTEDGFLVYLIEVDFNKTEMQTQIYEHVNNIVAGSGGVPKITYKCWKDSDFKILYYIPEYEHLMTGPFIKVLQQKNYLASPSFESILDKIGGDFRS